MAGKAGPAPVREPGNPVAAGDNLTPEERKEALFRTNLKSVMDANAAADNIKSALKAQNKLVTEARQRFKRETEIELQDLDAILRIKKLQRTERSQAVMNFNWMAEMEGLAPGGQMSIFGAMVETQERTPVPAKDALEWEMEGRQAYQRNEECKPPLPCPPEHHQVWMKGWHFMEERTIWSMAESGKIMDRDPSKDRSSTKPPLTPVAEDEAAADATADVADEPCATCGGDGSALADDVLTCPTCETEYEPPEEKGESVH